MKALLYLLLILQIFHALGCKREQTPALQLPEALQDAIEQDMRLQQGLPQRDSSQITALLRKGDALVKARLPDSALTLFKQALAMSYGIMYKPGIAASLLKLGDYAYQIEADYRQARAYYAQAITYSQGTATMDRQLFPGAYIAVGSTCFQEGDYDSANYFYYKALTILQREKTTDTPMLVRVYMNIGATLEYMDKNLDRSLAYTLQARDLAAYRKDTLLLARIMGNIGILYTRKGDYDSALVSYNYSLQLLKLQSSKKDIRDMYTYMVNALLFKEDIKLARIYIDSATSIDRERAGNNLVLLQGLGYIHYYSGEFTQAIPYYKQMIALCDQSGERGNHKLNSYAKLAALYDTLGQGRLAYHYQKAYSELRDSLINEEKISTINQLEIKYKVADKDRLLATKDLEIVKAQAAGQQKTAAIWIAVLCILLLLGMLIFLRYHQTNKLRRLNQQREMDLLKASMDGEEAERQRVGQDLHDGISGLLSAIKMNLVTLRLNREDIAQERNFLTTMNLADEAAAELRKTAHNLVSSSLVKKGLYQAIKGFCDRVSAPSLQLTVVETGTPTRLDTALELIIYRTVQELVHNMIKHAGASKGQVALSWQEKILLITVEDNGNGIAPDPNSDGIGLAHIRNSVKKLNGTIDIDSIPGEGSSIYLEYPL